MTQGFWKTHPEAWPVQSLTLGVRTYSQDELLDILNAPTVTDASVILASQLIAAKLNVLAGFDSSPVADAIAQADALLAGFAGALPYNVAPNTATGQTMVALAEQLDAYNNQCETGGPVSPPVVTIPVTSSPTRVSTVIGREVTTTPLPPSGLPPTGGYEDASSDRWPVIAGILMLAGTAAIFVMGMALRRKE